MTTTTPEAVQKGADALASAEQALKVAHTELLTLPTVFLALNANGNLESGLETMLLSARARQLAGFAADLELQIVAWHQELTGRAQELGIDLPPIVGRGATPLSGGR